MLRTSQEARRMLSSTSLLIKFLSDENVDERLTRFLKEQGIDIISKPKGISNGKLAEFSKSELRVLVTNDEDFFEFSKDEIFSIIWLKIPQRKIESSKNAFITLLNEIKAEDFEGNLIKLYEERFEISSLAEE